MDRVAAMPAVAAYKAHMRSLLAELEGVVLDVGCGLGNDVRALGDRCFGIDPSRTMLETATSRGGGFIAGRIEHLPVRPRSCAGVQADRVLQHLRDPFAAVGALADILRSGGVLVVADPEQSSLVIEGPDPALTQTIADFRVRGIRNPYMGSQLPELLPAVGLRDVEQASWTLELRDPNDAFGIPTWSRFLVDAGTFTEAQADRFDATLAEAATAGTFAYRIGFMVTWGRAA
jgi:SAM-dependent methyltransferase